MNIAPSEIESLVQTPARPAAPLEAEATEPAGDGSSCTVITLPARREAIFALLADVEALPRWAPGFCESVAIVHGRWAGLTALGELWIEIEADEGAGTIRFLAGEGGRCLSQVVLTVVAIAPAEVRIVLRTASGIDAWQARLARGLRAELIALAFERTGGTFRPDGAAA